MEESRLEIETLIDSSAIVCADLHVDLWTDYEMPKEFLLDKELNPLGFDDTKYYRLYQILMIARRIVYECKKHNTHTVFILGDLIHFPNAKPLVINVLKQFIKILTQNKITIYYIVGQHDNLTRKTDIDLKKDTFIGTLKNKHFIYSHKKQFYMGKQIIELKNFDWSHECNFQENTTVALSHISLGMGDIPKGKSLKLVVAGDIHDFVDGKTSTYEYHSTMTPFVLYPHQDMNGYIGYLDCSKDNPTYERISSNGNIVVNRKELPFRLYNIKDSYEYKENVFNEILKEEKDKEIEITDEESEDLVAKFDIANIGQIDNKVKSIAKENKYEDLYNELNLTNLPKPINFKFRLDYLYIENFKSVSSLEINFKDYRGCTFISGENGSGKSTILEAIEIALLGDRNIKKHLKHGEKDLCLDIILTYNKRKYEIVRRISKVEYYRSKVQKPKNDDDWETVKLPKLKTEDEIFNDLPFLNYLHYFIYHANSHFFDTIDRTQLIIDILNLNSLEYYKNQLCELYDSIKYDIKDNRNSLIEYETKVKTNTDRINDLIKIRDKLDKSCIIENSDKKLKTFQKLLVDIKKCELECKNYKDIISRNKTLYGDSTNEQQYKKALQSLKDWEDKDKLTQEILSYRNKITLLEKDKKDKNSLKNKLIATPKYKCPNCGEEFWINNLEEQVEDYATELRHIETDIKSLEQQIELGNQAKEIITPEFDKSESTKIVKNYESANSIKLLIEETEIKLSEEKSKGSQLYNEKLKMLTECNCDDDNKYIEKLNDSIKYTTEFTTLSNQLEKLNKLVEEDTQRVNKITKTIDKLSKKLSRCEKFANMFDMSNLNSIPYKIIEQVIHNLDDNRVRFTSTKELSSGEERFDINVEIMIAKDNWVNYDEASDGQQTILDCFILNAIIKNINGIGLLIMDESFANLDSKNTSSIYSFIQLIKKRVKNIFITSHSPYFEGYDKKLEVTLDTQGITRYVQ